MIPPHPAPVRDANGRFAPGTCGRPFGARGHALARTARRRLQDFEAHSAELLPRLRQWFLPQYIQLIVRLLPRPTDAFDDDLEDLDAAELGRLMAEVRAVLDRRGAAGKAAPQASPADAEPGPATVIIGDYR